MSRTLRVVRTVDYERYAGTWYEIARLPNRFERQCATDVTATYSLRDDGRVAVINRCLTAGGRPKQAAGIARRVDGQAPSVLQVRFAPALLSFLPFVWGDYQIIDLGPDYDYALVGAPNRAYLWILARQPVLRPDLCARLIDHARMQGFDVSRLIKTLHTPGAIRDQARRRDAPAGTARIASGSPADAVAASRLLIALGSLAIGAWGLAAPRQLARLMGDDEALARPLAARDAAIGIALLGSRSTLPLFCRAGADLTDALRLRRRSAWSAAAALSSASWSLATVAFSRRDTDLRTTTSFAGGESSHPA
jgi:apolipoprotein D and lipocalin family protein